MSDPGRDNKELARKPKPHGSAGLTEQQQRRGFDGLPAPEEEEYFDRVDIALAESFPASDPPGY